MEPFLSLPLVEQNVNPRVWAVGKSLSWAQNAIPVVVKLKDPHLFPHKKQYPLKPEVKEGLKPIIENLKEQGLLIPCNSPCNTPILGIKKSNGKRRLVQDLQIINEAVVTLLEKAMATHSSTLAWKIPWVEEPGRLQSMGLLRVWHDWANSFSLFTFMRWRRKWQPTPLFLPGEFQGWGSLVGCCLWGRTELDTTETT